MESFLDRLLADDRPPPNAGPAALGGGARRRPADAPTPAPSPAGRARSAPGAPRIAIYDTLTSPPRVIAVEEEDLPALIASLAEKTYHYCREQGGQVPYTVIQELIENLLHAYFRDVVVTILDNGQTIRISDHGPGVDDKERAFQPGFTTATRPPAAHHPRRRLRPAHRARVAAVPARRADGRGQPRRRGRLHHQAADPCRRSTPPPRRRPRSS